MTEGEAAERLAFLAAEIARHMEVLGSLRLVDGALGIVADEARDGGDRLPHGGASGLR